MFIETKVDILHQQVTKEKQYVYKETMRSFNHNLVLKTLKQVSFPLVSYVGQMDCLTFKSICKKRKMEKSEGLKEM